MIADKLLQLKNYLKYYEVQNRSFNLPEEELQFEQGFRLALISSGRVLFQWPEKGCFHKVGEEIQENDFKMGEIQIDKE